MIWDTTHVKIVDVEQTEVSAKTVVAKILILGTNMEKNTTATTTVETWLREETEMRMIFMMSKDIFTCLKGELTDDDIKKLLGETK